MIQFDINSSDITLDELFNRTKRINDFTEQANSENSLFHSFLMATLEECEKELLEEIDNISATENQ